MTTCSTFLTVVCQVSLAARSIATGLSTNEHTSGMFTELNSKYVYCFCFTNYLLVSDQ